MAEELSAGQASFLGGQDASKDPDMTPDSAFYAGINVTVAEGDLGPRWGWDRKKLDFSETGNYSISDTRSRTYESIFRGGRFQGYIPYSSGSKYYHIVVVSGVIYLIDQNTFKVSVIAIDDGSFISENHVRIRWSPADKYLIIYDFPNKPVIIENFSARRSDIYSYEVPVAVGGAYNQNRLAIYNAGNEMTLGDPIGNLFTPKAPITFEEVLTPASPYYSQFFKLTTNYGNDPITAFGFLQLVDNSTGIGSLIVSTPSQIFSYGTQAPRATWEAGVFGSLIVSSNGIAGERAFINVNSDLFYLSGDGEVRSLSMSRDEQGKWAKVPMSREIRNWLKFSDISLSRYASLNYFKNKIFVTVNPYQVTVLNRDATKKVLDYAHGGFGVMELDNISNLTSDSPPVWTGLWTGLRPMDSIINNKRMFIISKDYRSRNEIYEARPDRTYDTSENGDIKYVKARVYTREYDFGYPLQNKIVTTFDLGLYNVEGDFVLSLYYKPSHINKFAKWRIFKHTAPWRVCSLDGNICGVAPHNFLDLNLGSPEEVISNPVTGDESTIFRKMQFKIDITGKNWEIREFMVRAIAEGQNTTYVTPDDLGADVIIEKDCCNDDWFIDEESLCQTNVT